MNDTKGHSHTTLTIFCPFHRGAFCKFPFRCIYYYGSNKSTGKETGKTHFCAVLSKKRFKSNEESMLAALFCFFKTDYPASYAFFLMSLEFQMMIGNTETGITFTLNTGVSKIICIFGNFI